MSPAAPTDVATSRRIRSPASSSPAPSAPEPAVVLLARRLVRLHRRGRGQQQHQPGEQVVGEPDQDAGRAGAPVRRTPARAPGWRCARRRRGRSTAAARARAPPGPGSRPAPATWRTRVSTTTESGPPGPHGRGHLGHERVQGRRLRRALTATARALGRSGRGTSCHSRKVPTTTQITRVHPSSRTTNITNADHEPHGHRPRSTAARTTTRPSTPHPPTRGRTTGHPRSPHDPPPPLAGQPTRGSRRRPQTQNSLPSGSRITAQCTPRLGVVARPGSRPATPGVPPARPPARAARRAAPTGRRRPGGRCARGS